MAITHFASTSTPVDTNVATATATSFVTPTAVTPPANMVDGDLVVIFASSRATTVTFSISNGGGQSWTLGVTGTATAQAFRIFWCRFNGAWAGDPSINFNGGTGANSVTMHVFRTDILEKYWAEDVAPVAGSGAAPATPFDCAAPAITTATNGALALYAYFSGDDNNWQVQTAGFAHAGLNQYRNIAGTDQSISTVFKVQATAGAVHTGSIMNRQTALGGDAYGYISVAFRAAPDLAPTKENLLDKSEEFVDPPWTNTGILNRQQNIELAPDGAMTADSIEVDASGTSSVVRQAVAPPEPLAGKTYTFSVWFKKWPGDADQLISLRLTGAATNFTSQTFTATGEWQRGSSVRTFSSTEANTEVGGAVFLGAALRRIHVWGAQLNRGGGPATYIKTPSGPAPNQPPVANAGADQTITLPTNQVTLSGSGTDPDGTIASYAWTQQIGPNTATLTNANTATLTASGLVQGTYTFRLTVTDNGGATGVDDVLVTVNAAPTTKKRRIIMVI